jgi:hypothetical protein
MANVKLKVNIMAPSSFKVRMISIVPWTVALWLTVYLVVLEVKVSLVTAKL